MARYNEILVGRFNRALQKLTGIKGGPVTPQLSGDLQASVNMFYGRECRYLESWDLFASGISLAAGGAGNFQHVRMRNPAGSNVVVVFETCDFGSTAIDAGVLITFDPKATTADLTSVLGAQANLDPRSGRAQTLVISTQAIAAQNVLPNGVYKAPVFAGGVNRIIQLDDQEIPLLPGAVLQMTQGSVNQAIFFNLMWRERFLEDSERA